MRDRAKLAAIAAESGVLVPTAANLPVTLNDPDSVWYVERGAVDVFFLERQDGRQEKPLLHLLHVEAGRLLFGAALRYGKDDCVFVAKGLQDTVLRRMKSDILETLDSEAAARQVDLWITGITSTLLRLVELEPKPDALVEPGQTVAAEPGVLSARRNVVWLSGLDSGSGTYMGVVLLEKVNAGTGDAAIPLTPQTWIHLFSPASIECRSSRDIADSGILAACIDRYHALAFARMQIDRGLSLIDDVNLQREGETHRRSDAARAVYDLSNLLNKSGRNTSGSELYSALDAIGRHENIAFGFGEDRPGLPELGEILDVSEVRCRRIRLRAEDRWWVGDSGALLGFRADSGRPVALLPGPFGRYREVSSTENSRQWVTAASAAKLGREAFMFYAPLSRASRGLRGMARLVKRRIAGDLARFLATGLLGGLVALLPALLVGLIANRIIPENDSGLLYAAVAGLVAFASLSAFLRILQGTALIRMEGRMSARAEAAVWDRLLRLPSRFLNRFPAGNIAERGATIRKLRDTIAGTVADSLVSVVFLLPAFVLMVAYDPLLGGVSAVFGMLSLAVIFLLARRQVPWHRRILTANRRLSGLLLQLVNGSSKIRASRAGPSAVARWARSYREQKRAEMGLGILNEHLVAFSAAVPTLSAALLLAITDPGAVPVSDFVLIFAAVTIFQAAVVRLGASLSAVASVLPTWEVLSPILSTEPEGAAGGEPVGELSGEIRFDRVSFRYGPDGPPLLNEVSIHAAPGEFVAITGESGSGKSTLFRIALGIETPVSGTVYYDGRDMARLNLKQLRRRLGVVPQETALMPDNIWDNIVGQAESADTADVWRAARLAAIDREISKMPMGFSTTVGLCRTNLSGGECQRIMIAAALLGNPRILLLDEPTNWLDNASQFEVMRNIERLSATRLVIAHRLSTLQHADRIYMMRDGKVAQQGSYAELAGIDGPFRDLVRRQAL